jgi:lysophospholipase L1-like esterase
MRYPARLPLALLAILALALPASAAAAKQRSYYVSLGDSYAVGYQPNGPGGAGRLTNEGFSDYLYKRLRRSNPGLQLVKLGCGGATTGSMIRGPRPCPHPRPYKSTSRKNSQLGYAAKWMRRHRGQVRFVTISIGGNDVASCVGAGDLAAIVACVDKGVKRIRKNLPVIARVVRQAAGKRVTVVGTTYPNVVLGAWVEGDDESKQLAAASVPVFRDSVNPALKKAYAKQKIRFADATDDFGGYVPFERTTTLAPYGEIPVAVANICRLAWFCDVPDIHLRSAGYRKMATLIATVIRRS